MHRDHAVRDGGLVGTGPHSARQINRRDAFRNQLLTAGALLQQNLKDKACEWLLGTRTRIDIDNAPTGHEYVTGAAAGRLLTKVDAFRHKVGCG